MTIKVSINPSFMNQEDRKTCKYAPVKIGADAALPEMSAMKKARKDACLEAALGDQYNPLIKQEIEFTFSPGKKQYDKENNDLPPVFVISSGSAGKLMNYFTNKDEKQAPRLGWDLRWEQRISEKRVPIFIFVHALEVDAYEKALAEKFDGKNDYFIVGWSAGKLAGFGAARAAILHFVAKNAFGWSRVIVMDQDVLYRPDTDYTNTEVDQRIKSLHAGLKQDRSEASQLYYSQYQEADLSRRVVAYGIGYPTRFVEGQADKKLTLNKDSGKVLGLTNEEVQTIIKETIDALAGPTQQFVSIDVSEMSSAIKTKQATYEGIENIYPFYMIAGGEDVVMTKKAMPSSESRTASQQQAVNPFTPKKEVMKTDLPGRLDEERPYEVLRNEFLKKIFATEGTYKVESIRPEKGEVSNGSDESSFKVYGNEFKKGEIRADELSSKISKTVCEQDGKPDQVENEAWRISACIVERIIIARLRYDKAARSASKPAK